MESTEPGPEKDALQKRLDDITECWNDVKGESFKRKEDIDKLYPLCHAYDDRYVTFSVYLQDAEKRKNGLGPVSSDKSEVLKQIKELEVNGIF